MEQRILFGDYSPIIFSGVLVHFASCFMHRLSTLKNKYSNIFFYKTIAATDLKFYMEHDLPPTFQNYKIGSGRISKMAITFSPKPLKIFGCILAWNINGTYVFRIVKIKKTVA